MSLTMAAAVVMAGMGVIGPQRLVTPALADVPPTPVVAGSTSDIQHSVAASPHGSWQAVAANRSSAAATFRVSPDGLAWQQVAAPANTTAVQAFTITDSGVLFAVVTQTVNGNNTYTWWKYASSTWVSITPGLWGVVAELVTDGSALVAFAAPTVNSSGGETAKSTDDGASWTAGQKLSSGLSGSSVQVSVLGGVVHVLLIDGSGNIIYQRWDIATAKPLPVDARPNAPVYQWHPYFFAARGSTSTVYIGVLDYRGGLYVYKSADAGRVWVTAVTSDALPSEMSNFPANTAGSGVCCQTGMQMRADGRIEVINSRIDSGTVSVLEADHPAESTGNWSPVTSIATVAGGAYPAMWPLQQVDGTIPAVLRTWVSVPRSTTPATYDLYLLSGPGTVVDPVPTSTFSTADSTVMTNLQFTNDPPKTAVSPGHAWQAALVTDKTSGARYVLRSQDGQTWSKIANPAPATELWAVTVADTGEVYVGSRFFGNSNLFRYSNGRWYGPISYATRGDRFKYPGALLRAGNDMVGIEGGSGRISYSTDTGATWQEYPALYSSFDASSSGARPSVTVVGDMLHVLYGGYYTRWSRTQRAEEAPSTKPVMPSNATSTLMPDRSRDSDLWLGWRYNGQVGLDHSTDNGATWTTVDAGSPLPSGFTATSMALAGNGRLYVYGASSGGYYGNLARIDRAVAAGSPWSAPTVLDAAIGGETMAPIPVAAAAAAPPDVWITSAKTGTSGDLHHYGTLGGPSPIPDGQTYGPATAPAFFAMRPQSSMADPVNSATGSFTDQTTDAALPALGVPLELTRTYNSADPTAGVLGRGWTNTYNTSLTLTAAGALLRAGDGQQVQFTRNPDGSYTGPPGAVATLSVNAGGFDVTTRQRVHYQFTSTGRLSGITDRNNQGVTLAYDTGSHLASAAGSGRILTFGYDTAGMLTSATLPDGRSVGYSYTNGLLTDVRDLRGNHTTYAYDTGGRLASIQDANGHYVARNTYDPATGRITDQTDATGHHSGFAWNAYTQTTTMTAPDGGIWRDVYNGNVLTKQVDPLGRTTTFSYDITLHLAAVTDPAGNTTQATYDTAGNLIRELTPDNATYTYGYDTAGNQTSSTSPRGTTVTSSYDIRGNLTGTSRPNPAGGPPITTSLTRDPVTGLVTDATDARGKTSHDTYDTQGNHTAHTSPLGERATFTYDAAGRLTSTVSPRGNTTGANPDQYRTSYTYDDADHPLTVTDPLGHSSTSVYDPVGNLTSRTDAAGHTTGFAYTADNHLAQATPPAPLAATSYTYSANGQLETTLQPGGRQTSYAYDQTGQLQSVTNPQGSWHFGYDPSGNRTTSTDPAGNTVTIGYDRMHRTTSLAYPDGTAPVAYGYDADGNRTSMTDGAGTVTYTHDVLGRLTAVTRGADTFGYTYDPAGNPTSRTDPTGTTDSYAYDDDNRLAVVTTGTTPVAAYTYDPDSQLIQTALGNGITQTRTWDRAGRLTDITHRTSSGTIVARAGYTRDAVGKPTSILDADGTTTSYTYDTADRLTQACFASTDCATAADYLRWTYDDLGHRLTETRPAGTTTYTYNPKDQLTQSSGPTGTTTYGYDTNGNQTQAGPGTATFNAAGRMTSHTTGGATTSYRYDGDGRRLSATTGTDTTALLWDPASYQLTAERDATGTTQRRYSYGHGLTAMTTSGASFYYLPDGQGSTLALTDATGAVQWAYRYEPYGQPKTTTKINPNAPPNPRQWLGEYTEPDSTHLRARQYDPATGAFTSPDQGGSGDTYGYAEANPLTHADPLGLDSWRDPVDDVHSIAEGAAAVTGIAAMVCAASVVCAPADAVLGPIAALSGAVAAGTGFVIAGDECASPKGNCPGSILTASLDTAAAFGTASIGSAASRLAAVPEDTMAGVRAAGIAGENAAKAGEGAQVLKGPIADAIPRNLPEQLALGAAKDGQGTIIMRDLGDAPRLVANYGDGVWVKMQYVLRGTNGNVTVHYFRNVTTKMDVEFKFK
jgi:RHS repeat-associated protein